MPVVLGQEVESVLMGAAILGACASKDFASLQVCNHRKFELKAGALRHLLHIKHVMIQFWTADICRFHSS